MSASAAAAAALPAKDKDPRNAGKSSVKSGGSTKAALLFIGGIVALSGAVGYAKWSAENPVRKTTASSSSSKKNNKKASDPTTKDSSSASLHHQQTGSAQKDAAKDAVGVGTAETQQQQKEQPAAHKASSSEAADKASATKKTKNAKKDDSAKVTAPFAAAEVEADNVEEKKKKKEEEEEEARKNAAARKQKEEEDAAAAQAPKEATIKPLVEALSKTLNVNVEENLDIETDVSRRPYFAGHHIFAKNEIPADSTVLSMTGSLQFSVRTVDRTLQQGLAVLVHHAANIPSVKDHLADSPYYNVSALFPNNKNTGGLIDLETASGDAEEDTDETKPQPSSALDGDLHLLVLSMALEKRKGKASIWHPWLESLPPIHHLAQHHGMFVSDGEFNGCLPTRGQRIVNNMRLDMLWIRNATAELCRVQVPKLEPKLDAYRANPKQGPKFTELERSTVMARYLTCDVSQQDLDWAYTIISARSHLVGNVRTIFPLVDVMPYAVSANVKPGEMKASDEGKIISLDFVAARKIEVDEPLSFRTAIREPIEAVISQGFFDTDFFTDNTVPIGIFYHFDRDGETFNNPDLGDIVHCINDFQARSVPESGEITPEMLLCSELVFLKNATGTPDFELEKLHKLRAEHIDSFVAEQIAKKEKEDGKHEPQTYEAISKVAPRPPRSDGSDYLIPDTTRQTIRDKALEFITRAVKAAINVYDTRATCQEDARPFLGELQSHNDYVVSILEKTKLILGIEPEPAPMADH